MARAAGKTSVWLSEDVAAMLDQYEAANGKVNLSELLGEAVRRRTGQLNADELVAERATTAVTGVEKLQRELRALARRTAKLEKLAGVKA